MTHAAGRIATALVLALVSPPHVWGGAPTDALRDTLAGVNRARASAVAIRPAACVITTFIA